MIQISFITVTYNAAATVAETIESIDNVFSSLSDLIWEHIIVDGNSSDGTLEIINNYSRCNRHVYSEDDEGLYYAMNKGMNLANGRYLWFLNADDLISDEFNHKVKKVIDLLMLNNYDSIYGNIKFFDSRKSSASKKRVWIGPENLSYFERIGWHPPHTALIIKKETLIEIGGYDTSYKISADFKTMHRLFNENYNNKFIDCIFTNMRLGGISTSSFKNIVSANIECFKILLSADYSFWSSAFIIVSKLYLKVKQKWVS